MAQQRVLLVEDEDAVREVLVESLIDEGFSVVQAADGQDALQAFERDGIQLVLTDIHMPGRFDGVAVAEIVRQTEPGMPVVFITGRPDESPRALRIGAPTVLVEKPFNLDRLMTVVRSLIQARPSD
jgi:DNA-binding response OmpR family regulator